MIAKTQDLLRFYNRNAASRAKLDYTLMCGEKIKFDAETPFKITREGNVLTFPNWPNPTQYMYTHPGYDAVAKETAGIMNQAIILDAQRKGIDLKTVPQLEFIPTVERPAIINSVQDVINYAKETGQKIIVDGKPIG